MIINNKWNPLFIVIFGAVFRNRMAKNCLSLMLMAGLMCTSYMNVFGKVYQDTICHPKIKTVQLHREGDQLSYPYISLNRSTRLVLRFDDLSNEVKDYYYTIIHCDADWRPSDLYHNDYIDGFEENPITNYTFSKNTTYPYIHYQLNIPNNDISFKVSGNYVIKVYPSAHSSDDPVFTRRFFVHAGQADVKATVKRPDLTEYMDDKQQVDVIVDNYPPEIGNPSQNIKLVIARNNIWKTAIKNLRPKFIRGTRLVYDYQRKNLFDGGNEYRSFNCKDIDHAPQNIQRIAYERPYYHFYLKKDQDRSFKNYSDTKDINGNYLVQYEGETQQQSKTLADYVYVHFSFPKQAPVVDGALYVWGGFSLWNCTGKNKLKYNYDTKSYQTSMLLKQGFYNYAYVLLRNDSIYDESFMEGTHWQTENDYLIFVYARKQGLRYDKLLKVKTVNTNDYFR